MKRTLSLFIMFTICFTAISHKADAQFWKKIFRKEQPKQKSPVRKPPVKEKKPAATTTKTPASKKKQDIDYPKSVIKPRYRIDVLVPLYLDELVVDGKPVSKGKFPDKAIAGMDFYEGVKMASDTLNDFGYNIDVYIHDITDNAHWPEILVNRGKLDSSDLIIGAVPAQNIPELAKYARKNEINFVSALSPSDADIKDNPFYILMQPSLQGHCNWIRKHIENKYRKKKPVLYYRNTVSVDKEAYQYLTADDEIDFQPVLCNTLPAKSQLEKLFDSTETNVIVMTVLENAYAESLLQQLYKWFPEYKFEVFGMPSWRSLPGLRKSDAYPNVGINITAPFYFDASTASGQALANQYKKDFGSSKPGEMVYRGYETMYWFAYLLNKYGTIFNEKMSDNGVAPFTRYDIKPRWSADGSLLYNENAHINLYRYQEGSFSVSQ